MNSHKLQGLTSEEAKERLLRFGKNELEPEKKAGFLRQAAAIIREPMFLLLLGAALIYFFLGEPADGAVMLVFVVLIIAIDIFQEWKTDKTLRALRELSQPNSTVIRDGVQKQIATTELVPGDLLEITEGDKISVDGLIVACNDLCVDESSLTGEAEGVWKSADLSADSSADYWRRDYCYAGTFVLQGFALVQVEKTGVNSEYGKISAALAQAPVRPTPLQKQMRRLVKFCAWLALALCLLVAAITFFDLSDLLLKERAVNSILAGITLAMAMIPEEFPVVLTVFLSMGAWRLARKNSLIRHLPATETLGAISVLCVDKTGTLTKNEMVVDQTWLAGAAAAEFNKIAMMACEQEAYDPMEKAIIRYTMDQGVAASDCAGEIIKEYPFTNQTKMMAHVWQIEGDVIIAAKGSAESVFSLCDLSAEESRQANEALQQLCSQGLRVLAVATASVKSAEVLPENIENCRLRLLGLIALADPPRGGIKEDIALCHQAGIAVVMITGDNALTAKAIAEQVGIEQEQVITGAMLEQMSDEELSAAVQSARVFARVIPEHKMRIVTAFQANGQIVAMTGDGVNDAAALKYADIGIAMGKRGSEIAREAADLVLLDDNFSTIVDTIRDGRRIYDNIRKAIGYIFAIHIPIALVSLLGPMLSIPMEALMLLPFHIMLLELVIDPTCSVVLERQPAENNIMSLPPRDPNENILTRAIVAKGMVQGLVIFAASFAAYYLLLQNNFAASEIARSVGLTVLMIANLFLVQVNSSYAQPWWQTISKLRQDKVMWAVNILACLLLAIILYSPVNSFLGLAPLSLPQLTLAIGLGAVSVLWYELVKLGMRKTHFAKER